MHAKRRSRPRTRREGMPPARKTAPVYPRFFFVLFSVLFSVLLIVPVFLPLLLQHVAVPVYSQPRSAERFIVDTWTAKDGLPQDAVQVLVRGKSGYIWLGTPSGLVRFDGDTFRIYNRWNNTGPAAGGVRCIHEDTKGVLWIGTDGGGLGRLQNDKWSTYSTGSGLSAGTVRSVTGSGETVWAGTHNGLNRIKKGKIDSFNIQDGLTGHRVTALETGQDGRLWIGTEGGLNYIESPRQDKISIRTASFFPAIEVTSIYLDSASILWIGTENGLFRLEKNELQPEGKHGMLAGSAITAFAEPSPGQLWIGTYGEGIYRLRSGKIKALSREYGIPGEFIHSLLPDGEGNIWAGTFASGLVRIKTAAVGSLTTAHGLPESRIHAVLQDRRGDLWVGTNRKGLVRIRNRRVIEHWTKNQGLAGNKVRVIYQDPDQNIWVGTEGNGLTLLQYVNGNYRASLSYHTGHGLSSPNITAVYRDKNGTVWVGTEKGVHTRSRGAFTLFAPGFELANRHIRAIVQGRDGKLLAAARDGIYVIGKHTTRRIFPDPASQTPANLYDVLALYQDDSGRWWAGTNGSGLLRFKHLEENRTKFTQFTTAHGLPANYVFSITPGANGHLWFSSYQGVFQVPIAPLERDPQPGSTFLPAVLFDRGEGMPAGQCVMAGQPAACLTSSGQLYVPTVKGLAIFDSQMEFPSRAPPNVRIEHVLADNKPLTIYPPGSKIRRILSKRTGVVEFHFTAFSFSAPGKVKLLYKLEGYDTRWKTVPPRQKRMAFYLNLSPGDYCFRVAARGHHGAWNMDGARYEFAVGDSVSRDTSGYFAALIVLLAAVGMFFVFILRKRALKSRESNGTGKKPTARDTTQDHREDKEQPAKEQDQETKSGKYKTSALLKETVDQVLPRLQKLMEEDEVYLDAELNLKKLSQMLQVHYNHLSQIINEQIGKSFNDYINSFRIEAAKKCLADPAQARKTVLEIAYDTGFYSKSVFNTAFKKFTGCTPSQYRKENTAGDA